MTVTWRTTTVRHLSLVVAHMLLKLATELVHKIVFGSSSLTAEDVLNLALSCKTLHNILLNDATTIMQVEALYSGQECVARRLWRGLGFRARHGMDEPKEVFSHLMGLLHAQSMSREGMPSLARLPQTEGEALIGAVRVMVGSLGAMDEDAFGEWSDVLQTTVGLKSDYPTRSGVKRMVDLVGKALVAAALREGSVIKGRNALTIRWLAAMCGSVDEWLALGGDPGDRVWDGSSPLVYAVKGGNIEMVAALLDEETDLGATYREGESVIQYAAEVGNMGVLRMLLDHPSMTEDVVRHCDDVNAYSAMTYAVIGGDVEVVRALVEAGGDPTEEIDVFGSPLVYAAGKGNLEMVKYFSSLPEVDVNESGSQGTALHAASLKGHGDVVSYLLGVEGVDPDVCAGEEAVRRITMLSAMMAAKVGFGGGGGGGGVVRGGGLGLYARDWAVYGGFDDVAALFGDAPASASER